MHRTITAFLFSVMLSATVATAGELLINGDFTSSSAGVPMLWNLSLAPGDSLHIVSDNGRNYVEYVSEEAHKACVRQYSIKLVPGEKYRISMDFEAESLNYERIWCVVANHGWKQDAGLKLKPGELTTQGVQTFSQNIVVPPSMNNLYSVAFYMSEAKGKCRLHRMSLTPLTEAAEQGSRPCLELSKPLLAVQTPNRLALPQDMRQLPLIAYGVKDPAARLVATIDGQELPPLPFVNDRALLDVTPYRLGVHQAVLKVMVNGRCVVERSFPFAFAAPLPQTTTKRAGMTEELLNRDMQGQTEFTFVNPRDGWCYIGLGKPGAKRLTAMLDASLELFPEGYYRNETMRDLTRGEHKITLSEPADGPIVVRAVPMSYKYAGICKTNSFPGMFDYTLEWHKQHALGYSANFGSIEGKVSPNLQKALDFGITACSRFHVNRTQNYGTEEAETYLRELQASQAVNYPGTTFVDLDEYDWSDYGPLLNFADFADRLRNVHGKKIISCIASRNGPTVPGIHHYILEQIFNVSQGKGVVFFELYYGTEDTEEQVRRKISSSFNSIISGMEEYMPGCSDRLFFSFSNMNHPTLITSALHANVNFKYFLDLEMNLAANSEFGSRLYSIGFWGCHYADEDVNLWTQKLFRHYLAEGRTDMLSSQYGYTYIMPYLANGEFKKGFDGWEHTGEARIEVIKDFSKKSMRHWASLDESDTVAVLSPGAVLKTTAVQLKPGQKYKLEYVTADYEDVKANICDPKPVPISVELGNAAVLQKWDCVDRSVWKNDARGSVPRIHYYVSHFQPQADTMPLTFTCGGKEGKHYTLNFIKIEPLCE